MYGGGGGGGGLGGGTLIFLYIRRLGSFLGYKILNFNILGGGGGGFQKNRYFWGCEDFGRYFFESSKIWTIFRGHYYAF